MRKSVVIGCGMLLAAVVVGCGGGGGDEAIMKDQISLLNEMTGIMEKVTDAPSFEAAKKKMEGLEKKAKDLEAKTKDWSQDKKKAMAQKYEGEIKGAAEKMSKAMMAATMKAMGGALDKLKLPPLP